MEKRTDRSKYREKHNELIGKKANNFLSSDNRKQILSRLAILTMICVLAFSTRLFSVLRYESVIHEFDPYFNFRSTQYLVKEGFYNFLNWFDNSSWYPLGRIVGGTIYPGLMFTAAAIYHTLRYFNFTVVIRNVCVLLAPFFAANTAIATYFLTTELSDEKCGLVAAAMIAIVPGYISRSVAGSYDNEAIAIFALLFTYFLWLRSVNTGSMFWAAMASLSYFYMVSAWGGYVFIMNLIPMHVLTLLIIGRASTRVYVAYSTFYILGVLLSMQITFVGFQPAQSSEHMLALGTFGLIQLVYGINWVRTHIDEKQFRKFLWSTISTTAIVFGVVATIGTLTGYISPWTGRFYSLLDPTYAKTHIPIIASVSEHQPTTWASFFFDLHVLTILFPVGLYFCFTEINDTNVFIIIYGVTSVYFAGVMVRLMLVLAPVSCVLSGIAISKTLRTYTSQIKEINVDPIINSTPTTTVSTKKDKSEKKKKENEKEVFPIKREVALIMICGIFLLLCFYVFHCTWVTSEAYSSPSIVLAANQADGSRKIFDDFREAYYWLRMNTADDARIMSWWDYGYQLAAMANRTVLVDNNTWNNSHIAQVGQAMSSTEERAYEIMQSLDVDYVLIIFGGLIGYSSDDINKFLWMVRIGGSTDPRIVENDYYNSMGQFRVDSQGSSTLLNCLMYKLSYYRFGEIYTEGGRPSGWDRVRGTEIGNKNIKLD